MTLGERLKMYRTHKRLSQEKIAEMLDVSRQAATKWEAGQTTPSSDHFIALANLYDVSANLNYLGGFVLKIECFAIFDFYHGSNRPLEFLHYLCFPK